jgi:hypothetical protein
LANPLNEIGPLANRRVVLEPLLQFLGRDLREALGHHWIHIAGPCFPTEFDKRLKQGDFDLELLWIWHKLTFPYPVLAPTF